MNDATLRRRAREVIALLGQMDSRHDEAVEELLESPARYMLVGEHPRYGDRHVWGFRHTLEEAAMEFFRHDHGYSDGDLMVGLAYIYDLYADDYAEPIVPGPVEQVVKIGHLAVSDKAGILGKRFVPGDVVMVRSSGVSPVHFYEGTIVSEDLDGHGLRVYKVECDPWGEGREVHDIDALRVFELDPSRKLPYQQHRG